MWPFKEKQKKEEPKKKPLEDSCCFMEQITLDHTSGEQIVVLIQGKNGKHVEHIADKIKELFNAPKIDIEHFQRTQAQILEQFNKIYDEFNKGK